MGQLNQFDKDYLENMEMIYHIGLRYFKGDLDRAEDFVQDFFLFAKSKISTFKGESKFTTWLYRVAVNHALGTLRKDKKIKFEPIDESVEVADQSMSFVAQLEEDEFLNNLHKHIDSLGEEYRVPLLLFYYENMSIADISKELSVPQGTIKSYLHRAKNILQNLLTEEAKEN